MSVQPILGMTISPSGNWYAQRCLPAVWAAMGNLRVGTIELAKDGEDLPAFVARIRSERRARDLPMF